MMILDNLIVPDVYAVTSLSPSVVCDFIFLCGCCCFTALFEPIKSEPTFLVSVTGLYTEVSF